MKTESAKCANEIKKLLTKHFPTVKFSVKSDNFSMGNSVDVSWNLGPTTEKVDELIGKYQSGSFDGMTDYYSYDNSRDDIPQAKFVHSSRSYRSDEEVANDKLKWKDPARKDLYKEEKTLYHIIAQDLCKAMNIEYKGMYTVPPNEFQHMIRGYAYGGDLRAMVYQLANKTDFTEGYHGVRNKMYEGEPITNTFELY